MFFIKYVNYKLYSGYVELGDGKFAALLSSCLVSSLVFTANTLFLINIYCICTGNHLKYLFKGFSLEVIVIIFIFITLFIINMPIKKLNVYNLKL